MQVRGSRLKLGLCSDVCSAGSTMQAVLRAGTSASLRQSGRFLPSEGSAGETKVCTIRPSAQLRSLHLSVFSSLLAFSALALACCITDGLAAAHFAGMIRALAAYRPTQAWMWFISQCPSEQCLPFPCRGISRDGGGEEVGCRVYIGRCTIQPPRLLIS